LILDENRVVGEAQQQAGATLGTLIAANAPTLQRLSIHDSGLGDVGMGAVVDALPRNTHLRFLHCSGNGTSDAFVRGRLLPALRRGLTCMHE
jgi:hypothetical protein